METRTIVCYLDGIWRRLEQLERISGRFPSVDQSSRFAGVPHLGKPPGGGGTPIHYLYGDVPPNGFVILKLLI